MKKRVIFYGVLLILALSLAAQDFYDIETINEIEITFTESNWDQILDNYYAAGDEERLTGTALINGVQYDSVGVRYKGNSTYSSNRIKNPLNIKLDHVIDDQEIEGYGTLKLANVYNDPSFVRETLSYEIARKYMPASLANYIKVTINGTYLGLYTSVQSVDKYFDETNFGSKDNPFFKGELTNDSPQNTVVIWDYLGENQETYEDYYELKSDEGWEELINFLDIFNNSSSEMDTVLNVDRHLWMLAFDIALVNLDSPVNFGHNYYLYETGDGRFNPVIWDLNESFGVFSMLLNGGAPLDTYDKQHLSPYLNENSSYYPIISKVMDNAIYKQRYVAHMKTILTENFENGWYEDRAYEIQDIIDDEVQADPNKFYSYTYFLQNVTSGVGFGPQQTIGITQLMDTRASYLLGLSDFTASAPVIGELNTDPQTPQSGEETQFTIEIEDAQQAYLCWRTADFAGYTETELYDDGAHGDGAAGDDIFGVVITPVGDMMQYYIVADNSDASAFSPERAAYEYYTLSIEYTANENLAINEFMADNDSIVMDEAGEYDDWLELYNWNDYTLDLSGYFLSDDQADPEKWEIPQGIEIAAGEFLCFWADDDEDQGEMHTNFKLSASGETIILSEPSGNVIDEITFGEQETDMSYGRSPDGTGDFTQLTPSFGASNTGTQWIYGDITGDQIIDSYDAANILQYAVGLDPSAAPLPWTWQLIAGDVDDNEEVEAYDASLIMQFSVGLLEIFPVEEGRSAAPYAQLIFNLQNNQLTATAQGDLYSAVIKVIADGIQISSPDYTQQVLHADNLYEKQIAFASSSKLSGEVIKIPYQQSVSSPNITIESTVNGYPQEPVSLGDYCPVTPNSVLGVYPNPFNPETNIKLSVNDSNTPVQILIYNMKGQVIQTVFDGALSAGTHNIQWNGTNKSGNPVGSGIYFYRAVIGNQTSTGKMVMLK